MKAKNITPYILSAIIAIYLVMVIVVIIIYVVPALEGPNGKYDDEWIIGKTEDEIQERYGEFDINYGDRAYGYRTKEERNDKYNQYYVIYFDQYGYACAIKKNCYPKGG